MSIVEEQSMKIFPLYVNALHSHYDYPKTYGIFYPWERILYKIVSEHRAYFTTKEIWKGHLTGSVCTAYDSWSSGCEFEPHVGRRHYLIKRNSLFKTFFKFIYFERERERESREGAEREGKRESQARSVLSVWSPTQGSIPWTVRSWAESKSRVGQLMD